MSEMTTGRYFAETLSALGVTHVFYVPIVFRSALAEMGNLGIVRVVAHHEVAAAYMADGYARAARRPGVCMAQQVGAANLAAGLRDAHLAGSPVIAVTGGPHPDSRYQYLYQVIEDFSSYVPYTKFNAMVEKPSRFPDLLRQAIREATTGTPGPVRLEFPGRSGEGAEGPSGESELIVERQFGVVPPYRPAPEAAQVEAAARALAAAERPIMLAGGGVVRSGAGWEVVALAEKLNIPVATSPTGKGSIPEDHPLCIGVIGTYGSLAANRLVRGSDLVFFVGSRAGDLTTNHYRIPPKGVPAIQLDINPAEVGRVYPVKVGLVGDARVSLARLIDAAEDGGKKRAAWVRDAQERIADWRAQLEPLANSDASPIRPERLCREISEVLPENGVLVADTGHAANWTGNMVSLTKPGQRYIRCMGTLGWALPGCLGVKCALPDSPVLAFTGDGGMYYHVAELETAARMGINAVIVVNNNSALGQVKRNIGQAFGGTSWGDPSEVYGFRPTNFARLAEEMGCVGIRVDRADEIRPALEAAFSAGRPVVVDVATDVDVVPAGA